MLLDSQVVLWSVTDGPRLGSRARHLIQEATSCFVSTLTHVELTAKTMQGTLATPPDLPELLRSFGFAALPLEDRHVVGLRAFESLVGHDPFDRMLLAQALVDKLDFLTADGRLLALDLPWIIDATQ
ncbi:MAG: hypothetical protein JWQ74_2552 [Marmoricola sp.]|nr:hypothetical protein [Marmoricola sp.]